MGLSSDSRRDSAALLPPASDMLAVCRAASRIERNTDQAADWYLHTRIAELDGLTAANLVALGRTDEVMRFLEAICSGARD